MNRSHTTARIFSTGISLSLIALALLLTACSDPPPPLNPRIIQVEKNNYIQCEEINQGNLTFKCDPNNIHPLLDCDKNGGCIAIVSKEMADLASWARRHASDTCKPGIATNPIIDK